VRSGGIYFDDGTVGGPHSGGIGDTGPWWSSRSYSSTTNGYYLVFGASDVHPSASLDRWRGFPLRCLSTVLGM